MQAAAGVASSSRHHAQLSVVAAECVCLLVPVLGVMRREQEQEDGCRLQLEWQPALDIRRAQRRSCRCAACCLLVPGWGVRREQEQEDGCRLQLEWQPALDIRRAQRRSCRCAACCLLVPGWGVRHEQEQEDGCMLQLEWQPAPDTRPAQRRGCRCQLGQGSGGTNSTRQEGTRAHWSVPFEDRLSPPKPSSPRVPSQTRLVSRPRFDDKACAFCSFVSQGMCHLLCFGGCRDWRMHVPGLDFGCYRGMCQA